MHVSWLTNYSVLFWIYFFFVCEKNLQKCYEIKLDNYCFLTPVSTISHNALVPVLIWCYLPHFCNASSQWLSHHEKWYRSTDSEICFFFLVEYCFFIFNKNYFLCVLTKLPKKFYLWPSSNHSVAWFSCEAT